MLVSHKEGGVFIYLYVSSLTALPPPPFLSKQHLCHFSYIAPSVKQSPTLTQEKEEVFPGLISLVCAQGLFQCLLSLPQGPMLQLH